MNNSPSHQTPTLQDVARRAGVSSATVSRCLNMSGVLRPETRAKVEAAIAELGYTPNFGARALASRRTGTIGVVIPTMENAIFARGLQAMEETLAARNITLLVATSGYDPARELEKIRALLARGVDGLALIGFERPAQTRRFLEAGGRPFVLLWNYRAGSPHPCVGFDNRRAAELMAERVLDFGHRRIAMIAGHTHGNDRATARVAGVRDALSRHGLSLGPDALLECPYAISQGEEAALRLLSGPKPPSVIICGNDVLAAGALRAAGQLGICVPDGVSVTGFDDIDLALLVEPGLTTVRAPHRRMGAAAAEMLFSLTNGAVTETRVCFETKIVERGSLAGAGF